MSGASDESLRALAAREALVTTAPPNPPHWRDVPEDKPLWEVARDAFYDAGGDDYGDDEAWEACANAVAEVVATRLARKP